MEWFLKRIAWFLFSYYIGRPILSKLGFEKLFKEKIKVFANWHYEAAARNNTNRASIVILLFLTIIIFGTSEIIFLNIWNPPTTILDQTIGKAVENNPQEFNKWVMFSIFILNVILIEFVIRLETVYRIVTRFKQLLTIIRPDIDNKEYHRIKREWALMKSRESYNKIITDLFASHAILRDNKDKFPEEIKLFEKYKRETIA